MKRIAQVDLHLGKEELDAVSSSIEARWLTEGPHARRFGEALSDFYDGSQVCFAPNGTLGLFLAIKVLDLPPGSEVIIPSFTFYASASSVVFAGLKPVFVDCVPGTLNIDSDAVAEAITPRTSAIMPVHIYGQACDLAPLMDLAARHGLAVVEDAAQALGVTYRGRKVGTFGDLGVISFFSDKVITTGEGGAVLCQDRHSARLRLMRNQGRESSGTFVHSELGMNFRITDLQAAIGLAQLEKFPAIHERRMTLWNRYAKQLEGVGDIALMEVNENSNLVPFRFPFRTKRRPELEQHLERNGVQTRGFFYPLHLQPKLREFCDRPLPVSQAAHEEGLCLPIHWHVSNDDVDYICEQIQTFYRTL